MARTVPPEALRAVHQVELAVEWVERAWGALLDAHHRAGHAQGELLEAARMLDEAGLGELAERTRHVSALDFAHGRWTYQIVDEFRTHLLEPARELDEVARATVTGGVRHCFEAAAKRRDGLAGSPTSVTLPGS